MGYDVVECARDFDFFLSFSSMFPFAGIPLGSQLFSFSPSPGGLVWDYPHPQLHTKLIVVFHSPGHTMSTWLWLSPREEPGTFVEVTEKIEALS